jgi:hypothetical protein
LKIKCIQFELSTSIALIFVHSKSGTLVARLILVFSFTVKVFNKVSRRGPNFVFPRAIILLTLKPQNQKLLQALFLKSNTAFSLSLIIFIQKLQINDIYAKIQMLFKCTQITAELNFF